MPEALLALDGWLLKTTLAGGVVLLIGTLWMAFTRQPVKRQRIGELALLAALLVALPAAMPSWWSLPGSTSTTSKTLFGNALPSQRLNGSSIDADKLYAAIDQNETEEEWDPIELVDYLYTLRVEEKEENDAAIVNPSDNAIEHNCTQGDSSPLFPQWGRWILRLIGFAYMGLVAVLLIRCSIGYYGLWRFWRQRRPAPAHVHAALAELEPDPAHRPRIGVNSLVHGPVSYGLWKPTILLPPAFCNEGDPEKLRWILAHELTHLRRRDAWGCLLLALGGALYFHVPWFWWMKRHVRLAQEYLADAAAAQIANAVEYAQYLVSLTTLTSRPSLASSQAVGVFESPSDLYRRVHMLLHQRSVVERGAPRWWTLTAAASFLTLAACTAGINLYADEPPKADDVKVILVAGDDDEKDGDKKKKETKTFTVNGKFVPGGDGKTFTWTTDDAAGKPGVWAIQGGALAVDKKKSIDEAMKKLEQVLAKLPKDLDGDTRAKLEELKKTLKSLKDGDQAVWLRAADAAKEGQARARVRALDALKDGENQRKAVEEKVAETRNQVLAAREHAMAAEKLARVAQERALVRWKEAKDGDDKDQAIRELERAIAEKERALKALKADGATVTNSTRVTRPAQRAINPPASNKGRLGVVVADIDGDVRSQLDLNDGQGLMIQEVIDPSPAWNNGNGLRSSDILVELAGKKVPASQEKFREMVTKLGEGNYSAVVYRKGKKLTIGGIKLPATDKAKTVVLDGVKVDPTVNLTFDLVNRNPEAKELVLQHKLLTDLHDNIHLNIKPEIVASSDQLVRVQKQLHDKQAALDLAHAKIAKGDVVIANPAEASIKLDNVKIELDQATQKLDKVQIAPGTFKVNTVPMVTKILSAQDQGASKPRLGVTLEEVPEVVASQIELAEDRGLFVREVIEGSAAQKAGFLKNDIIIVFANKPVTKDHGAFTQLIKDLKPGKYTATVVRKGKEIRIRDINLVDTKAAAEEKKTRVKEWVVDGDDKKHEEVKEKMKDKDSFKKKDDFFPQAGRALNLARAKGNTSVTINNDQFTASQNNDGKTISVTGKMVNGKAEPNSITIKTDDGEKKYKSAKDVPEGDRAAVEKMLTSFKGNVFLWNGNGQEFFNKGQLDKQLENQLKVFEKSMKQIGEGNPGFEQMEREIERLREQLKKMRGGKDKDDDNNN